jgi:hypothetical protein
VIIDVCSNGHPSRVPQTCLPRGGRRDSAFALHLPAESSAGGQQSEATRGA